MKIKAILSVFVFGVNFFVFSQETKADPNMINPTIEPQAGSPIQNSTTNDSSVSPSLDVKKVLDAPISPSETLNSENENEGESAEIESKEKTPKGKSKKEKTPKGKGAKGKKEKAKTTKDKTSLYGKKGKQFKDMSVQLFFGQPFIVASAVPSVIKTDIFKVYDIQFGYIYQITHSLGLQLLGQIGKTRGHVPGTLDDDALSESTYQSLFLLGDVNLSSFFRRSDFKPSNYYKWSFHAYGGVGTIAYKNNGVSDASGNVFVLNGKYASDRSYQAKLFQQSWAAQLGYGVRRRINKSFDVEFKQSFLLTNDKTFDGAGPSMTDAIKNNNFTSGNMLTTSLGVHYKIGKKKTEHLSWVDPLQKTKSDVIKSIVTGKGLAEYKSVPGMQSISGFGGINGVNGINTLGGGGGVDGSGKLCTKDSDDDGVCDDWDRELTTAVGARVDGSGVALDVDKDSVIDLFDQCVVVPGEGNPTGCPEKQNINNEVLIAKLNTINMALEGIDFDFNSAVIKPQYFTVLDQAGFVMNEFPTYEFYIRGHTDANGSDYYNYVLSKKRAESVKTYLMDKQGVAGDRLVVDPKGESDLKNPECQPDTKCDEAKNRENRRIVFIPIE